jgi:hypothetical protein
VQKWKAWEVYAMMLGKYKCPVSKNAAFTWSAENYVDGSTERDTVKYKYSFLEVHMMTTRSTNVHFGCAYST